VCLEQLPAAVVRHNDEYFLEKKCPEHGFTSTVVWRGASPSYESWGSGYAHPAESRAPQCPHDCGLCPAHRQKTCCALVEITRQCDLDCAYCFADGKCLEFDCEHLFENFLELVKNGNTFVQLSGGEPTMREDLPDIIKAAARAGCENIQLNTNGLRIGTDREYAERLRDAGMSFVFMQFDGTDDDINIKLRGRRLLAEKIAAIKTCSELNIGVALVPTLIPGVNDHDIGNIIDFGLANSPAVRGIHFQPVSYIGRHPKSPDNKDRITLPEILRSIEEQTDGKLKISDFNPSNCDHPYCGFHGDFVVLPKKKLIKLTSKNTTPCCGDDAHLKNRDFISRRWTRAVDSADTCCSSSDYRDFNTFLSRTKSHGFTITAMAFQDAYNLDLERLSRCSLHVSMPGRMVPFCSNYMTAAGAPGIS
jgi:hypothetical protein